MCRDSCGIFLKPCQRGMVFVEDPHVQRSTGGQGPKLPCDAKRRRLWRDDGHPLSSDLTGVFFDELVISAEVRAASASR